MSMPRPVSAKLDAIFDTAEEIRATEAKLKALKVRGSEQAQALASIPDKRLRLEAAIYAYWHAPEINASDIAFGATGRAHPSALLKLIGPVSVGVPCDRCATDLPITSRAMMKETLDRAQGGARWFEGYRILCVPCQEAVTEERHAKWEKDQRQTQRRRAELRALPYGDYLKTEEWRDQRDWHLWMLLETRQADLGCETCGAHGPRGIFHTTRERLGWGDELILLCETCETALRGADKLIGPPTPDNQLSAVTEQRILKDHEARYGDPGG